MGKISVKEFCQIMNLKVEERFFKQLTSKRMSCSAIVDTMEEFCREVGLEAIGRLARKEDGVQIGFVVKIKEQYYIGDIDCWVEGTHVMLEEMENELNLEEYNKVEDCEIRMEYWDVTVDDEGPIFQFAFPKNETEKIHKILQFDADFDIWIDGEKYSREDALALLNKK